MEKLEEKEIEDTAVRRRLFRDDFNAEPSEADDSFD